MFDLNKAVNGGKVHDYESFMRWFAKEWIKYNGFPRGFS